MTLQLYCFGESGNAYKAALALELAGLDWTPVFVDFFNGAARSPAFRALNEMGEVPVLVDGGETITQSGAILFHIAEKTGRFLDAPKSEILRWILWDGQKGSGQQGPLRFLMNFLPEEKRPREAIAFLQGRTQAALKVLDAHMTGRDWVAGEALTIADLACCGYLYYPEPFGFSRADFPAIDAWLTRLSGQPGWNAPYDLMPGSPADRA